MCPAGQHLQGLLASAQQPQPRQTSHSHCHKGPDTPLLQEPHLARPASWALAHSPSCASCLARETLRWARNTGSSTLTASGRQDNSQQWLWDSACHRGAPQPPASTQLGHYLCGHPRPMAPTLSGASEKSTGSMVGEGSQVQTWEQEGARWAKGLHAAWGADASKLLAGIFGSHCQVLGGRSSVGPEGPHGLHQPLPMLPSPSCQKAHDPSSHPPCCPLRRPSHLSRSLRPHQEHTACFVCTLQCREEPVACRPGRCPAKELS